MRTTLLWSTLLFAACTGAPAGGSDASTDAPDVSLDVAEASLDAPDVPTDDDVPTPPARVVPPTWAPTPPPSISTVSGCLRISSIIGSRLSESSTCLSPNWSVMYIK